MHSRPANPKDALLAWAYHRLLEQRVPRLHYDEEFLRECEKLIPNIHAMSVVVAPHADEAVRQAIAEQNRLVDEIWNTRDG